MPEFHNQPNFQVTAQEDGKRYWISRSAAIVALPFFRNSDKKTYLPFVKRSEEMELYPGAWALVSGFLDFDESAAQCLRREFWEETGLDLQDYFVIPNQPTWVETEEGDTIGFRYCLFRAVEQLPKLQPRSPEVTDAQFLPIKKLYHYFPLAFNHAELIEWGAKQISLR